MFFSSKRTMSDKVLIYLLISGRYSAYFSCIVISIIVPKEKKAQEKAVCCSQQR